MRHRDKSIITPRTMASVHAWRRQVFNLPKVAPPEPGGWQGNKVGFALLTCETLEFVVFMSDSSALARRYSLAEGFRLLIGPGIFASRHWTVDRLGDEGIQAQVETRPGQGPRTIGSALLKIINQIEAEEPYFQRCFLEPSLSSKQMEDPVSQSTQEQTLTRPESTPNPSLHTVTPRPGTEMENTCCLVCHLRCGLIAQVSAVPTTTEDKPGPDTLSFPST